MSYVFFDLEWNQGYPHHEAEKIDEIIQIGAYRLDNWQDRGTSFSAYVRPSIHKKLHHQVKKMLPLDMTRLKQASNFKKVARDFFHWCGKDAVFFTWGTCDARVLDTNLCWYGMEEYLDLEIYDLQRAFDLMVLKTNHQTALETAVEVLGLNSELEYHDAGNDAAYTARIGAELIRRFGKLPTEEELAQASEALRQQRKREAARAADLTLHELIGETESSIYRKCSHFENRLDCMKSRGARVFHCPSCESWLCNGNWYCIDDFAVSRSRCMEHGRFYSVLRFSEDEPNRIQGDLLVYDEESFPIELFQLVKQGADMVEVRQMPHKRRRTRKGKIKLTPKTN